MDIYDRNFSHEKTRYCFQYRVLINQLVLIDVSGFTWTTAARTLAGLTTRCWLSTVFANMIRNAGNE